VANGDGPWAKYQATTQAQGPWTKYATPAAPTGGTPITDTSKLTRDINPAGIENYTPQGRAEHPNLAAAGDVGRNLRELLFGGQSAGKPMGTSSGIVNNPVTGAMSGAYGAEMAAGAIPTAAKAGAAFEDVMGAAKHIPIDVAGPGDTALRIQKLAESGGSMPKVIRDFLRRATDPEKPPITYAEARDFYSNASRLSADEMQRLTPVLKRQVAMFTKSLNESLEGATEEVGKLSKYKGAMKEYRQAKRLEDLWQTAKEWAAKGALGAGGYYAAKEVLKK
jgi:hypothetical protein